MPQKYYQKAELLNQKIAQVMARQMYVRASVRAIDPKRNIC